MAIPRRRSVFASNESQSEQTRMELGCEEHPTPIPPAGSQPGPLPSVVPPPQAVINQLRMAEEKKRRRPWDERNRNGQVTYRCFPQSLKVSLREVAESLRVSVDELARAFLEHGLTAYQQGSLLLNPMPKGVRMTLFAVADQNVKTPKRAPGRNRKGKNKDGHEDGWHSVVSYRGIPVEVQDAIRQVAEDRFVPVGEVAVIFIQFGLRAFQSGKLRLQPVPKAFDLTLFGS